MHSADSEAYVYLLYERLPPLFVMAHLIWFIANT